MKRIFLEISSGQGPEECRLLTAKLARFLSGRLMAAGVSVCPVDLCGDWERDSLRSVLFEVGGKEAGAMTALLCGTVLWISASPFRPHHKRRNWFAGIRRFEADPVLAFRPEDVEVTVSRSSGPGGQHVNTADTRVQALHRPTGLRTTACEERSQLQNRRLALARLAAKLAERNAASLAGLEAEAWRGHRELERGNPAFVIRGRELWDLERFGETVFFR